MVFFLVDWGMGDSKHTSNKQQNVIDDQQQQQQQRREHEHDNSSVEEQREGTVQSVQVTSNSGQNFFRNPTTTTTIPTPTFRVILNRSEVQTGDLEENVVDKGAAETINIGGQGNAAAIRSSTSVTTNLEQLSVGSGSAQNRDTTFFSGNFAGSTSCGPKGVLHQHPLANVTAAFHQFLEQKGAASDTNRKGLEVKSHSPSSPKTQTQPILVRGDSSITSGRTLGGKSLSTEISEDEVALQPLSNQVRFIISSCISLIYCIALSDCSLTTGWWTHSPPAAQPVDSHQAFEYKRIGFLSEHSRRYSIVCAQIQRYVQRH